MWMIEDMAVDFYLGAIERFHFYFLRKKCKRRACRKHHLSLEYLPFRFMWRDCGVESDTVSTSLVDRVLGNTMSCYLADK